MTGGSTGEAVLGYSEVQGRAETYGRPDAKSKGLAKAKEELIRFKCPQVIFIPPPLPAIILHDESASSETKKRQVKRKT
jgi:hypothetical protein